VSERRRQSQNHFSAIAKVIDLDSQTELVSVTRNLSLSGCLVKTAASLPKGTNVRVRITSSGEDFGAIGKVTGASFEGTSIEFIEIEPNDRALLEKWLGIGSVTSV
jgi:hypothetical protein